MDESQFEWQEDIRRLYPDWNTPEWKARWQRSAPPARVGDALSGHVIARAPFGVWLEFGLGCPALLLVPYIAHDGPLSFEEYPALGEQLTVRVRTVGPTGEIGVTQRLDDSGDVS